MTFRKTKDVKVVILGNDRVGDSKVEKGRGREGGLDELASDSDRVTRVFVEVTTNKCQDAGREVGSGVEDVLSGGDSNATAPVSFGNFVAACQSLEVTRRFRTRFTRMLCRLR